MNPEHVAPSSPAVSRSLGEPVQTPRLSLTQLAPEGALNAQVQEDMHARPSCDEGGMGAASGLEDQREHPRIRWAIIMPPLVLMLFAPPLHQLDGIGHAESPTIAGCREWRVR